MQRWRGVEQAPSGFGRSVVTIGVFDGVHRGHRQIIGRAVERAKELGLPSVVVTFDPHPTEVVRPGTHPAMLTSQRLKAELIEDLGVDVLCVIPFTQELSRYEPGDFVLQVLVEHLHASTVIVGDNFRFGHDAAGDVQTLRTLGTRFGFVVEGADLLAEDGITFSSTFVRSCVASGDVRTAAMALGRPHRLDGIVVRGDQRGRAIGFPTANLDHHRWAAIPADGVYAGWLTQRGKQYMAAIHVGTNSTFAGTDRRVEAFVLDFDGDLYGEHVSIDFIEHLRGSVRFPGVDELVAQMNLDVAKTREILS